MRVLFTATICLLVQCSITYAQRATLRDISVVPKGNIATVSFLLDGNVQAVVLNHTGKGHAQIRMRPVAASKAALASAQLRSGVRSVKSHIERTDVLVCNLLFNREVARMVITQRNSKGVIVQITFTKADTSTTSPTARKDKPVSKPIRKWSIGTIIIDAGHGGKDPGAIGLKDVQEKTVTLSVAQHLRDEIKREFPTVNVVMTRNNDTFVELYRRWKIANKRHGKLFISIHCNSTPQKPDPATGIECYILRPGKNSEANGLTAAENGVIRFEKSSALYVTGDATRASIAGSTFQRHNETLANNICDALHTRTGLPCRGVHEAGFYVLVGAAMPSVLVEIGYLTNETDVKILSSASGRKKIARGIFEGIKSYEKVYASTFK